MCVCASVHVLVKERERKRSQILPDGMGTSQAAQTVIAVLEVWGGSSEKWLEFVALS